MIFLRHRKREKIFNLKIKMLQNALRCFRIIHKSLESIDVGYEETNVVLFSCPKFFYIVSPKEKKKKKLKNVERVNIIYYRIINVPTYLKIVSIAILRDRR